MPRRARLQLTFPAAKLALASVAPAAPSLLLWLDGAEPALAQVALLHQTRTLNGTALVPNQPYQTASETVTTDGVFNDSKDASNSWNGMINGIPSNYSSGGNAKQNTTVSSGDFLGSGLVVSVSQSYGDAQLARGTSTSAFTVYFTVGIPTSLALSGDLNITTTGGEMEFVQSTASISLSSSDQATPLYSLVSNRYGSSGDNPPTVTVDEPISYSTLLLPGPTYTLALSASAESQCAGTGFDNHPGDASFNFTALAPEPDSLALLLLGAGAFILRRRRWQHAAGGALVGISLRQLVGGYECVPRRPDAPPL
jgi:hypothetical protein